MSLPGHDRVVVVVVLYNSAALLPDFAASLDEGLRGLSWTLVAADNDSHDDSVATLRRLVPGATVLEMRRNAGYAAGINAAVAAAGDQGHVLVLNPDVRLAPGCGARLAAAVHDPGVGIAVPRIMGAGGVAVASLRREPTLLRALGDAFVGASRSGRWPLFGEIVTDPEQYCAGRRADWAEGSAQLISRACWDRCGPWDERFFLYSEETDFDLRARDLGFATAFVPEATVVHLKGESQQLPGLWALLVLNRLRLYRLRNGAVAAVPYWAALVTRELSRALLGKATSRAALKALLSPARLRETPGPGSVR